LLHDHHASKPQIINSNEQSHYRKATKKRSKKADKQKKVWDGNLNYRIAYNKSLFLIERLNYAHWTTALETGFEGFISVRTSTIPKDLATWLL